MNGYQRITSVLNGIMPDHRPVMLHSFLLAVREANISMKDYREDKNKAAGAHIQFAEKYDTDGILIDIDTATLSSALGVPTDYPEYDVARNFKSLLKSLNNIKHLKKVNLENDKRVQHWLETCRIVKNHFGKEKFVRGNCDQAAFSLASLVRGLDNWMVDLMVADEELVHQTLIYCCGVTCQFIELMAQTGVDMVSNGDSVAGPDMISPELYSQFAFPYEKLIIEKAHQLQLPYMLHICGNTDSILNKMQELGLEAVELDYKTNISKIKQVFGERTVFCGNIDPSGVLAMGQPHLVEEKVVELLSCYKGNPRLIINAGCAIPAETPAKNIKRLIEVSRSNR